MAAVNGEGQSLRDDSTHLGKRRRSASPEKKFLTNGDGPHPFQQVLRDALDQANRSETKISFLQRRIPTTEDEKPNAKRVRLTSAEPDESTIEKRILSGYYKSQEQLLEDVALLQQSATSEQNEANGDSHADIEDEASRFMESLGAPKTQKRMDFEPDAGQIIMLRSMTDNGVATLYSGLQSSSSEKPTAPIDGRKLPNGFDLAKPIKLDQSFLAPPKQPRKFADVFGPHRNTKALEMPRNRTALRSNTLTFSTEAVQERPGSFNRQDYKIQQMAASSWVDYSKGHTLTEQDTSRKYRDKGVAANDFRAALIANDHSVNESDNNISLFKQAFSSFAPVTDSSLSLVNDQDRNRMWWHRKGTKRLSKIFSSAYPDLEEQRVPYNAEENDDFEDVLNYDPAEADVQPFPQDEPQTIDDVLEEISQLLETVHSYQRIRGLETRQSADPFKPSNAEFDTYEILRSQLAILVASVPPFVVSKLDGDKLSDLNISSNLTLETVDYRGTMQPDDFTLAKYRAAHQPSVPRLPQATTPAAAPRQQYPTQQQAPATHQNSNLQAYTQNLGVQAQYAQRQAQQYATPQTIQQRPNYANYQQPHTNSQIAPYSSQPTVQQFQRQQVTTPANGYNGAWNTTKAPAASTPTPTPTAQNASFAQAPSQPGYQQRAQRLQQQQQPLDYTAVAMQHTPTRATAAIGLVNGTAAGGQGYYPQQQQQQQGQQGATGYTPRPVVQQQYQQPQQAQR